MRGAVPCVGLLWVVLCACSSGSTSDVTADAGSDVPAVDSGLDSPDAVDTDALADVPSDATGDAGDREGATDPACLASCGAKTCGDDGCGGTCGTCTGGKVCVEGACQDPASDCGNGMCGEGEDCQSCPADCTCVDPWICDASGACIAGLDCTGVWRCLSNCENGLDCLEPCRALGTEDARDWIDALIDCLADACELSDEACMMGAMAGECASVASQCCLPSCSDRNCGDDGCGGVCGTCGELQQCLDGNCACIHETCGLACCDNDAAVCFEGMCCTPQCNEQTCGDDGCGGVCGTCGDFQTCKNGSCECAFLACGEGCCDDAAALCVEGACCVPDCAGRDCGTDGCGGACGACDGAGPWACVEGLCTCDNATCGATCCAWASDVCFEGACCLRQCDGRNCGDDQCGGSCGTCSGAQDACVEGVCACIPDCDGRACGQDGCGDECGTCEAGTSCIDFECLASVGGEIVANQQKAGNQTEPELVRLGNGDVLLAWRSQPTAENVYELRGRVFSAKGAPVGDEFSISGALPVPSNAEVSLFGTADGALASWVSARVHIVRLDNAGAPIAGPVTTVEADGIYRTSLPFMASGFPWLLYSRRVSSTVEDFHLGSLEPDTLAWRAAQPVLMDWTAQVPASSLVPSYGGGLVVGYWNGTVAAFSSSGGLLKGPAAVTATMPAGVWDKPYPRLAAIGGKVYAAVYDLLTDDKGQEVRATRFDENLVPLDQDVALNTVTEGSQWMARLSPLADTTFVVAWWSDKLDGDQQGIALRRVGANGVPTGTREMTVPQYTSGFQATPAVLGIPETGDVLVAWVSGAHPDTGEPYDISLRYIPAVALP